MNPIREPEPESFIRVCQGLFGSGRKRVNLIVISGQMWVESKRIRVGSTCYQRSKMNETRQPKPEPDIVIRAWVRGYSSRVINGSTRLTRILFGSGMGLA